MEKIIIYSDGGCDPNPGAGGWGYVLIHEDKETEEAFGGDTDTTNNKMELTAVIKALDSLQDRCTVKVFSDSKYVVNGINHWLQNWMKSNFKNGSIKNQELWRSIWDYKDTHDLYAYWVRGHSGVLMNERADQLATKGRLKALGVEVAEETILDPTTRIIIKKSLDNDRKWGKLIRYLTRNKWDFSLKS